MKSSPVRGSVVMSLTRSMPPGASRPRRRSSTRRWSLARQVVHHVEHVGGVERALERRVAHVADDELVVAQAEPRRDVARDADAPGVGIDADDAPARVRLAEVRGEEAEAAPDVEDAPLVGQEQVHDAEELRPQDREAHERVRPLDGGQRPDDSGHRVAAVDLRERRSGPSDAPTTCAGSANRSCRGSPRADRGTLGGAGGQGPWRGSRCAVRHAPVAQLDRAVAFEATCRGFESLRAYSIALRASERPVGVQVFSRHAFGVAGSD